MKQNNAIVVWRIVFTYMILFFHMDCHYGLLNELGLDNGLYIATDFFFVVSGFLLYAAYVKKRETIQSGPAYLWTRVKRIAPFYLSSYLFIILFQLITTGVKDTLYTISFHFWELLGLHAIGLNDGWTAMNNSTWFISAMLIAGFLIYHCLSKWHDTFLQFVMPIVIMVCISYLYRYNGSLSANMMADGLFGNFALMRAMSEMCLGICAYKLNAYLVAKNRTKWASVIGSGLFLIVIIGSVTAGFSKRDFLYLILMVVAVSLCFVPSDSRLVNNSLIGSWSGLTLVMYLNHMLFADGIMPKVLKLPASAGMKAIYILIYMAVVTVFSIIVKVIVDRIRRLLKM